MPNRHAILGPSSAYRWLTCTPSARFEEQLKDEESEYALEGTLAHDLAALILSSRAGIFQGNQAKFNEMLNEIEAQVDAFYEGLGQPSGFVSMMEHAEDWAAFVCEHIECQVKGEILIEQEYDLSEFIPVGFGTADATTITRKVLYVDDYKYGAGVMVSAKDNPQLKIYALGAYLKAVELGYDEIETVVISIFQPRAGQGLPSSFEISVKDLLVWAETTVRPKALLAIGGQGDFVTGKHCQFCKARNVCGAYYDRFAKLLKISDKRKMTDADLRTVLTFGGDVSSWVKKVQEDAVRRMQTRQVIDGFKLVAGRGKRTFKSEDDVVETLLAEGYESDQIFNSTLRSLTDIEKTLGKKKFAQLFDAIIINQEGAPQIAADDDDRPAIGASAADDYDDFEDLC